MQKCGGGGHELVTVNSGVDKNLQEMEDTLAKFMELADTELTRERPNEEI